MLEIINTATQTVAANGTINLGNASITDNTGRMVLSESNIILLNTIGKHKITGTFTVTSTTASAITIQMYANSSAIGIPVTVNVGADESEEIVIQKTIPVIPALYGNTAKITFVSSTGGIITNALVDVFKRS